MNNRVIGVLVTVDFIATASDEFFIMSEVKTRDIDLSVVGIQIEITKFLPGQLGVISIIHVEFSMIVGGVVRLVVTDKVTKVLDIFLI